VPEEIFVRRVAATLRARPLSAFFLLAYAVSWAMWTPMLIAGVPVFSGASHTPSPLVLPGIAVGVTGSAFLMTRVTRGRAGVRHMFQRLTCWRVGLRWYLVAVLLIPVGQIALTAVVAPNALRALSPAALAFYPGAYLAHFIFGPLFEESGWRGFALPRLQSLYGPLKGTLLLGLLWSGWHFFLYVPSWLRG
jgi:membrane protease YdiL (CAAX protease family)